VTRAEVIWITVLMTSSKNDEGKIMWLRGSKTSQKGKDENHGNERLLTSIRGDKDRGQVDELIT
jgi:hypothetical protein